MTERDMIEALEGLGLTDVFAMTRAHDNTFGYIANGPDGLVRQVVSVPLRHTGSYARKMLVDWASETPEEEGQQAFEEDAARLEAMRRERVNGSTTPEGLGG